MKRPAGFLFAALLAVAATPALSAQATAPQAPVVAQELVKVRTSSRVQAATWTRRPDSYTLQLVFHPLSPIEGRALKLVDGRRITPIPADRCRPAAAGEAIRGFCLAAARRWYPAGDQDAQDDAAS